MIKVTAIYFEREPLGGVRCIIDVKHGTSRFSFMGSGVLLGDAVTLKPHQSFDRAVENALQWLASEEATLRAAGHTGVSEETRPESPEDEKG